MTTLTRSSRPSSGLVYAVLSALALFSLAPLLLMLLNSLRSRMEISMDPLGLPRQFLWGNYLAAWQEGALGAALTNSLVVSGLTVLLTCVVASMAAYSLARRRIRAWAAVSVYLLVCTTIPVQLFLIPLFFIFQHLHLVNSRPALALIYTALYTPFSIFLLRAYFLAIPVELEEAARVDGASDWQVFARVLVPMIAPGLMTVALVVGLWSWNEFLLAVTFLQDESLYTATVRFYGFSGRFVTEWGKMMASAVILVVPVIAAFAALQRKFIEGMTAGGIKG
ncbi:carbohydrate ABC transporter permease [Limnochorda pilosa]|uniref:Sugar ABC transporter permease n=1 Tax=Limnochorda pilosa TaxID=1555112 RepID=A0A0K2SLV1_LIMPI|nr:carbohydrate ABC transporter permease [Limnochorda pilosa]BAS27987.1 sugar ABC transporter permease [Limnochorda pilosa]